VNNWKVIPTIVFATVLIFGAGVFTGGMLVNFVKQSHPRSAARRLAAQTNAVAVVAPAPADRPLRPPEMLSKDFLQRLDTQLQLGKDQHDAIQKIINDSQNLMRKVVQDGRLEIRETLNPAQREQFDELMKRPFRKPLFGTNAPAVSSVPPSVSSSSHLAPTNAP
jgi:uncharacterized membrane protein